MEMSEPNVEEIVGDFEHVHKLCGYQDYRVTAWKMLSLIASWRERGERVAELQAEVGYSDSIRAVARKQALEEAEAIARAREQKAKAAQDKATNEDDRMCWLWCQHEAKTVAHAISALAAKGQP
jgi:hypothetical protein